MAKYRILSMDGGGIRGILTARLLERIAAERPGFLSQTDLFAGTSTGSILAICLARGAAVPTSGLTPAGLVALYRQHGKDIFRHDILRNISTLWGLAGARFSTGGRLSVFHEVVGDITLADLLPKHVLVATFQLDGENPLVSPIRHRSPNWKAKFFHNYEGIDSDGTQKALDVMMRSSAAPTYFPIYEGFVDGGVVANNPSVCALTQAINVQTGGRRNIDDVALLSIGTGTRANRILSRNGNWGMLPWGFNLLDLIFESGSGLADYQCHQLLDTRYVRLNPDLKSNIALDNVRAIDFLLQKADAADLTDALRLIDEQW